MSLSISNSRRSYRSNFALIGLLSGLLLAAAAQLPLDCLA